VKAGAAPGWAPASSLEVVGLPTSRRARDRVRYESGPDRCSSSSGQFRLVATRLRVPQTPCARSYGAAGHRGDDELLVVSEPGVQVRLVLACAPGKDGFPAQFRSASHSQVPASEVQVPII